MGAPYYKCYKLSGARLLIAINGFSIMEMDGAVDKQETTINLRTTIFNDKKNIQYKLILLDRKTTRWIISTTDDVIFVEFPFEQWHEYMEADCRRIDNDDAFKPTPYKFGGGKVIFANYTLVADLL